MRALVKVHLAPRKVRTFKRSNLLVPSYVINDKGLTECVPVVECKKRCPIDGKAWELSQLMYGAMPEQLAQIVVDDQMTIAEKVTTAAVRRFGDLESQKKAYEEKFLSKFE